MLDVFRKLSLIERLGRFCSCGRPASYLFTWDGESEFWCKRHRDKSIEVNSLERYHCGPFLGHEGGR